jgi:hypothetical protein
MSNWSRFLDWLAGRSPTNVEPPSRHERREAARERHRESGAPLWTADDLEPMPGAKRQVADVAPGTPGDYGSVRTIRDD